MTECYAHFKCDQMGNPYAGDHLLLELWGAKNLTDGNGIQSTLQEAATRAGAHVLHSYLHPFGENLGVSGVVVLSESHISIHTWPEYGYAAIDIFMCGACNPMDSVPILEEYFQPARSEKQMLVRGVMPNRRPEMGPRDQSPPL